MPTPSEWVIIYTHGWMITAGLEKDVQYNDHELPTQLRPDQYFKLQWALSDERQELQFDNQKEGRWGEAMGDAMGETTKSEG